MMQKLLIFVGLLLVATLQVNGVFLPPAGRTIIPVRYGYFTQARPNHAACALGWFDLDAPEENVYYKVSCYPQASGNYAASKLDNLQLDLANLGSTPWASAAARGVDIIAVYVSMFMGNSQGLYVRPDDNESMYKGIVTPYDLVNRTVAVPFGSTMHYQILFLIDLLGLKGLVNVTNMSPSEIIHAWDDPKRDPPIIDAAGCWGDAREHLLRHGNAKTLISASLLADWGRPTFVVTAATRTFAQNHHDFMVHFVGILSRMNDSFLDRLGQQDNLNVDRWDVTKPVGISYMPSLVDVLMKPGGIPGKPNQTEIFQARDDLEDFIQHSAVEQISCQYLGPRPRECTTPTSLHVATRQTAEFLIDQKLLAELGPLDPMGDDSNCQEEATLCGSDLFDGHFLQLARRTCVECIPVGPFAASATPVSSLEEGGSDELLKALEYWSGIQNNTGYATDEIGRVAGDSTCKAFELIEDDTDSFSPSPWVGQIGDGANSETGRSYSDNKSCTWEIRGFNICAGINCQTFVELQFEKLRLWAGDYIRIYTCEHGSREDHLLAQLTGFYDDNDLPTVRAQGCMTVIFESDPNEERVYSGNSGDGFVATYTRNSLGCQSESDCNGRPCKEGHCDCGGDRWGADCSHRTCLGTSYFDMGPFGPVEIIASSAETIEPNHFASRSSVPNVSASYPNDLDCVFEIRTPDIGYMVELEITYDLEETFDLLWLQSGYESPAAAEQIYAVLTGTNGLDTNRYYIQPRSGIVSLHLQTDMQGRRQGFHAKARLIPVTGEDDSCENLGESGHGCEFEHCISNNNLVPAKFASTSGYILGRVVSQTSDWTAGSASVPAMPWAPNGGCAWPLPAESPKDVVALRLLFNSVLDLEPQPAAAVRSKGDKFVIQSDSSDSPYFFFVEECDSSETCSLPWQTGQCSDRGGCIVHRVIETPFSSWSEASILLTTDRNDGGQSYTGLDFDVALVKQCPFEEGSHCEAHGGSCTDGYCYCENNIPCSCSCEGEAPTSISTGVKIGIVLAVVVPIFGVFFAFFWFYRRRKIARSRQQKAIIESKEAELEAFRNSVVGIRTALKKHVPCLSERAPQSSNKNIVRPLAPPPLWCWRETEGYMKNHKPEDIVGDVVDCWIRYDEDSNSRLEAAYNEQGCHGEYKLSTSYVINFDEMIQTKIATGFEREVKRVTFDSAQESEEEEVDLSDVTFGNLSDLPDDLVDEPQMVLVTQDIIQISKQRDDGWAFGTKLYHADEALSRKLVSYAVGGASDDASILADTGWFRLDDTRIPTGDDLAALQTHVGDTGELAAPAHWEDILDPNVYQEHLLDPQSDEYQSVLQSFSSTLPSKKVKVLSIKRIQNLGMWQSYVVKRQTICYRETKQQEISAEAKKKALERFERYWLWHGTQADVKDKILQQGFNRSFCGKNATVYGKGVYFARDASYSADPMYAVPDSKGVQYILACRVVVGEYCRGQYNALTPDVRDAKNNILYDSTVGVLTGDSMKNPSIYVTYHDAQAYPEYLIAFRL